MMICFLTLTQRIAVPSAVNEKSDVMVSADGGQVLNGYDLCEPGLKTAGICLSGLTFIPLDVKLSTTHNFRELMSQ